MIKRADTRPRTRQTGKASLWSAWTADERGAVTVMVALTITGLLAMFALAIDLSALFDARSEAQRAADAAALAGASAFLEYQQDYARSVAIERAMELATSNEIRNALIQPEDVTVSVNLDSATVRAQIRRDGVPTWFARLIGFDEVAVAAEATAWAGEAGAAQCVKPFAIPDMWEETNDDANHNRIWDEAERWRYDPGAGDRYVPYSGPGGGSSETGYGSNWRDGYSDGQGRTYAADYGRRITVKTTDPQQTIMPSFFLPWVLPPDPNQPACGATRDPGTGSGGGGDDGGSDGDDGDGNGTGPGNGQGSGWFNWVERRGGLGGSPGGGAGNGAGGGSAGGGTGQDDGMGRGAARYRQNICSCNASIIDLDTEYVIEPGNMVGPTYQGVQTLIQQDPDAYWDDRTGTVVSEYGMDSPRVITVALFNPAEISKPGRQSIRFNNFARVFIEEQESPRDPVTGRMLYYVSGVGQGARSGATTGSLVRTLQLIR
ncbi:MAG: pilus assembly protein TadG-related protein [Candidatus Longimicrobiales bacterium M2_2A_002]